jgi:hypothetical protein
MNLCKINNLSIVIKINKKINSSTLLSLNFDHYVERIAQIIIINNFSKSQKKKSWLIFGNAHNVNI